MHLADVLIISVGAALLCWVLLRTSLGEPLISMPERIARSVSPIGDVMIVGALARLLLHDGRRIVALRLLSAAIGLFLAGDGAWIVLHEVESSYLPGRWVRALLTGLRCLAFVLAAAAPLHPSAQHLTEAGREPDIEVGPVLLTTLSLACLVAPGVLLVQTLNGAVPDGVAIAVFAALLILLVIARMEDLVRRVRSQTEQLKELALEDPVTGLANRRALPVRLASELEMARRQPHSLAVALIDLDLFQRFTDTHGHAAADRLLRGVTEQWRGRLRASDFLVRLGAENFLVVLPAINAEQTERSIARLQAVMPLAQTFSAGFALWDGQETAQELIGRAQAAMHEAQQAGGDRCAVALATKPAWPLVGSGVPLKAFVAAASGIPAARRAGDGLVAPPPTPDPVGRPSAPSIAIFSTFRSRKHG